MDLKPWTSLKLLKIFSGSHGGIPKQSQSKTLTLTKRKHSEVQVPRLGRTVGVILMQVTVSSELAGSDLRGAVD